MNPYYEEDYIKLYHGDCLKVMDWLIEQNIRINAIITDIPYGTTSCKWDSVIPFNSMWDRLNKISYDNSAVILFGSQPFTTELIHSNIKNFKYCWVWEKSLATGGVIAKKRPMKKHEDIVVFCKNQGIYNPQMVDFTEDEIKRMRKHDTINKNPEIINSKSHINKGWFDGRKKYPTSILKINSLNYASNEKKYKHPTQKPEELMEYLIKTYTNEGDLILDFTCGSGATLVAAKNLKRKCIGIDNEDKYCEIAKNRIQDVVVNT